MRQERVLIRMFMIRLFFFSLYFWIWYTNIIFEYFRPHRVLFKNWIWWNIRTENVVKNFCLHNSCESLRKSFSKNSMQVSSGLLSHLRPSPAQKMATRASILVPPQHPGFLRSLGSALLSTIPSAHPHCVARMEIEEKNSHSRMALMGTKLCCKLITANTMHCIVKTQSAW